ncbi:MAG: hypothetical protein Q7S22_03005 [Candidatus Micrarchaeota archaeon]|nr:hypothetical protein [Candidatus Micrarchaeota archaeon]
MKKILTVMLFLGLVLVGCLSSGAFKPSVDFRLDRTAMIVSNNNFSSDFVTATITRLDNDPTPTQFVLKFKNKADVYAVNADGQKIDELSSKILKGSGAKDTLQFKIYSKSNLATGSDNLEVELDWNNTIVSPEQIIAVNVR